MQAPAGAAAGPRLEAETPHRVGLSPRSTDRCGSVAISPPGLRSLPPRGHARGSGQRISGRRSFVCQARKLLAPSTEAYPPKIHRFKIVHSLISPWNQRATSRTRSFLSVLPSIAATSKRQSPEILLTKARIYWRCRQPLAIADGAVGGQDRERAT